MDAIEQAGFGGIRKWFKSLPKETQESLGHDLTSCWLSAEYFRFVLGDKPEGQHVLVPSSSGYLSPGTYHGFIDASEIHYFLLDVTDTKVTILSTFGGGPKQFWKKSIPLAIWHSAIKDLMTGIFPTYETLFGYSPDILLLPFRLYFEKSCRNDNK